MIDGAARYAAALARIGADTNAFEAETFIRGALYHCDLAFVDGRPVDGLYHGSILRMGE